MIGSSELLLQWIGAVIFWSTAFLLQGCKCHEISGCFGDTVTISCGPGDRKINILGDFYGLSPPDAEPKVCGYSNKDVCVVPSHSHSSVAKQVCNGRSNCIFTISERHTCTNTVQETTYQQIKYECIPASQIHSMCSDHEWSSHAGFLTSANYPIFYPPRASCTCTLRTADESFILLKTAELRLKASSPCRDYLQVEPASNPEEQLCGTVHRIYEARSFTLYFHTQLTSYKGFMLSFEAASPVDVRCFRGRPHTTTLPTTTTQKVTLPTSLPQDKSDAIHQFETALNDLKDRKSHETPSKPSLTSGKGRYWGRTRGRQGGAANSKKQTTFGSTLSPSVRAPVRPVLHTVSGCFGDIVHFQCKDGELIRIVKDIYGSAPVGRCSYKKGDCVVEALGQKSIVSQICSSKTRCMNFIVTRMFCGERVTSYQEIYYECVPATALNNVCSETVITSSEGYLASPNFPGMYPRNQSCSCTLRAAPAPATRGDTSRSLPSRSWVRLDMAHFALHDLEGCEDWLDLDVGDDNPAKRLCGSQYGVFSGQSVQLTFRSNNKYSHSGFWFHFKGENDSQVVIACNVPVQSVWPTTSTTTASTTPTTPTTTTTRPLPPPTTSTTTTSTQTTSLSLGDISRISVKTPSSQTSDNSSKEQGPLVSIDRSSPTLLKQQHLDDVIGRENDDIKDALEESDFQMVSDTNWEEGLSIEDEITTGEMGPMEELPAMEPEPETHLLEIPEEAARTDPATTVKPAKKQPVASSAKRTHSVVKAWTVMTLLWIPVVLLDLLATNR